jgi:phage gp36-like protein
MSAYTTLASVQAKIASADLIAALDDNQSGALNLTVFNQIVTDASTEIEGLCSGLYVVPFNPVPPIVSTACLMRVCYEIYRRALTPDEKNTFKAESDKYFAEPDGIFCKVRDKSAPFDVNTPRVYTPFIAQQWPLSVDMTTA